MTPDYHRWLRLEVLEDRCMLSAKADIVFLVDESKSDRPPGFSTVQWLQDRVLTDPAPGGISFINSELAAAGIDDVVYGLVGFGQADQLEIAHSYLVAPSTGTPLVGNASQIDTAAVNLANAGGREDGFDAIEHAIAEYNFREGTVPILILLQNEEGRNPMNPIFTHDGILAALQSKRAILNTLSVGSNVGDGVSYVTPAPVFDFSSYASGALPTNFRILGVDSDAGDGSVDGLHTYDAINSATGQSVIAAATKSNALQISYNGSNTGHTGMVATGKSILFSRSASQGFGPSAGGYRGLSIPFVAEQFTDSNSNEISDLSQSVQIPFGFSYYGVNYSKLWVSEDGTVRFGNLNDPGDPAHLNVDFSRDPSPPSIPMIAAFWDDLIPAFSDDFVSSVRVKAVNTDANPQPDMLAIQWHNYALAPDAGAPPDTITFQLQIYSDGRIILTFEDIDSATESPSSAFHNVQESGGLSATVGIWKGVADNVSVISGKYAPGLQSIFGSTTYGSPSGAADFFDSNDSYIRMAWDTGGSAWDLDVVSEYGVASNAANALRAALVKSIGNQVTKAVAEGKLYHNLQVVAAYNLGGPATTGGTFAADPQFAALSPQNEKTTSNPINLTSSNAVAALGVSAAELQQVFSSARTGNTDDILDDVHVSVDTLPSGTYVIELLFCRI